MECVVSAILALCIIPPETGVVVDSVDVLELNTMYDDDGHEVLQQMIFHDRTDTGFRIIAWRLLKQDNIPASGPFIFDDGETTRVIHAKLIRRSFTQYDPELRERDVFPKERRRGLTVPKVAAPEAELSVDDLRVEGTR